MCNRKQTTIRFAFNFNPREKNIVHLAFEMETEVDIKYPVVQTTR